MKDDEVKIVGEWVGRFGVDKEILQAWNRIKETLEYDCKSRDKEIAELKEQIESMYNITTVTKNREKDEYWGYWETCNSCGSSMISESNYCPNCGKRIKRGAE